MQRTIRLAPLGMLAVAFAVVVTLTVALGDSTTAFEDGPYVPCPTVAPGPTKTPDGATKTPSPTGTPCKATLTPTPTNTPTTPTPIGGIGIFPDVPTAPLGAAASSGGHAGVVAGVAAAVAAGAVALGAAACYARRRRRG